MTTGSSPAGPRPQRKRVCSAWVSASPTWLKTKPGLHLETFVPADEATRAALSG